MIIKIIIKIFILLISIWMAAGGGYAVEDGEEGGGYFLILIAFILAITTIFI